MQDVFSPSSPSPNKEIMYKTGFPRLGPKLAPSHLAVRPK